VLLIGDSECGKSSLLLRYVDNMFSDESKLTIGVDHRNIVLTINDKTIKLIIWDTAGKRHQLNLNRVARSGKISNTYTELVP
jgi:Ras-related protein Rab-18